MEEKPREVDNRGSDVLVASSRSPSLQTEETYGKAQYRDNDAPVASDCPSGQVEENPLEADSKDNDIPVESGCPSGQL